MTTLRQNFIRELVLRGMSPRTQESYVGAVYYLARYYHKAPDVLSDEELKDYLFHLAERRLAASTLNQQVSALVAFTSSCCGVQSTFSMRYCPAAARPFGARRSSALTKWNSSLQWDVRILKAERFS